MKSEPHIAFVIDSLPALGGGERVLFTALECFPNADVFTLVYNKDAFINSPLAGRKVRTSYIDALPFAHKHHRMFLPLMPSAIERLNLQEYDVIISFSYAVAHGAKNYNGARHLSYTYTPMRYAWMDINIDGTHTGKNPVIDKFMQNFREWDRRAASRVHQFASISQAVARRIQNAYQREAPVIYPPVEIERFHPGQDRSDYYVTVSRLVAHKRIDLLVQAFSQLNLPLMVIGDGPELPKLQKAAGPTIQFPGYVSDEKVAMLLSQARGFACAAEEDFGIAIVEAQAAGCPVIAYGQGGALDTVTDGVTGMLFEEQSVSCLIETIAKFQSLLGTFDANKLIENARRFSKERFMKEFLEFVG